MQQTEMRVLTEAEPALNVADLLAQRAARTPDLVLFQVPAGAGWRPVTARAFRDRVVAVAKGLIAVGHRAGRPHRPALLDAVRVVARRLRRLVRRARSSCPCTRRAPRTRSSTSSRTRARAPSWSRPRSTTRGSTRSGRPAEGPHVWQLHLDGLDKLVEAGRDVPDEEVERRRQLAVESDVATIIYTAGTTGRPKGCVLTHGNFVELARNTTLEIPEIVNDRAATLLFVTLAHVFARFISVLCVHAGVRVGHQGDTSQLVPALGSFKPTFLLAVPRVFEKVYNSAEQTAESGGRGAAFRWAADVGVRWSEARTAGHVPLPLALQYRAADALVFRKLRAVLGGNCRWAVSGSAPLGKRPQPLLPRDRRHDPRGLRPHRDDRADHREPAPRREDRHGRPAAARLGGADRRRRRDRAARHRRLPRVPRRTRRRRRRRSTTAGSAPATSARSTTTAT